MAAVAAANETDQQAAAAAAVAASNTADNNAPRPVRVDPQLLMAARLGDSKQLKQLLGLNDDDDKVEAAAASEAVVVVDVVLHPRRSTPPAAGLSAGAADVTPASSWPLYGETAEGDSLLHVVAECGDGLEFRRCAKLIYDREKRLLDARNDRGDTPLHCAAGAGNDEMISCLIDLAASGNGNTEAEKAEKKVAYLRVPNKCGETALHHAVRAAAAAAAAGNKDKKQLALACIDRLIDEDPQLAAIPLPNEEAASPLYLAISLGEIGIAKHLFVKSDGKLSCSGPNRRNVLHAAVSFPQALPMVLKWLNDKKLKTADMREQEGEDHRHVAADDDLLSRLTSQRDNDNGSTPLHLAASMNALPSAIYIPIRSPRVLAPGRRPRPAAGLLLDANESAAYQADNQGMYPIHVAASAGSVETVKILLKKRPDCATLRDARGRTFLHAAVETKMLPVVKYVCHWKRKGRFALILNAQDNNGDTALHRAVHSGDLFVFRCLIWCQEVRLDVPNKKGMRPIDVSWSTMPLKRYYAWDPRIHIRTSLLKWGAPYGESRGDLFHEKRRHTIMVDPKFKGGEEKISENVTTAAQVLALFSVLITTVTFASAFTLPGGFRSAGDGGGAAGTPLLAGRGSYAFDAFILSDALAFVCSFMATSILLYAGVPAYSLDSRFAHINFAYSLMMNSGRSLVAALALGLYVVLLPPVGRTIAIAIAAGMIMLAVALSKASEGIESLLGIAIARNRKLSIWDRVVGFTINVLEHYWSFILIFGLPAIRKWARAG